MFGQGRSFSKIHPFCYDLWSLPQLRWETLSFLPWASQRIYLGQCFRNQDETSHLNEVITFLSIRYIMSRIYDLIFADNLDKYDHLCKAFLSEERPTTVEAPKWLSFLARQLQRISHTVRWSADHMHADMFKLETVGSALVLDSARRLVRGAACDWKPWKTLTKVRRRSILATWKLRSLRNPEGSRTSYISCQMWHAVGMRLYIGGQICTKLNPCAFFGVRDIVLTVYADVRLVLRESISNFRLLD